MKLEQTKQYDITFIGDEDHFVDTTYYVGGTYDIIKDTKPNYKFELDLEMLLWFKNLTFQPFKFIYGIGIDIQTLYNIEMSLNQYYENIN